MSEISNAPLAGVRVIESSMLGPAAITTHLADLGADVIKVESPSGDYVRVRPFAHAGGGRLKHELPNDGVLPIVHVSVIRRHMNIVYALGYMSV